MRKMGFKCRNRMRRMYGSTFEICAYKMVLFPAQENWLIPRSWCKYLSWFITKVIIIYLKKKNTFLSQIFIATRKQKLKWIISKIIYNIHTSFQKVYVNSNESIRSKKNLSKYNIILCFDTKKNCEIHVLKFFLKEN